MDPHYTEVHRILSQSPQSPEPYRTISRAYKIIVLWNILQTCGDADTIGQIILMRSIRLGYNSGKCSIFNILKSKRTENHTWIVRWSLTSQIRRMLDGQDCAWKLLEHQAQQGVQVVNHAEKRAQILINMTTISVTSDSNILNMPWAKQSKEAAKGNEVAIQKRMSYIMFFTPSKGKKHWLITQQDTLSGWIPHLEGYLLSALLRPDKALILQNYLRPARLLELSILPWQSTIF